MMVIAIGPQKAEQPTTHVCPVEEDSSCVPLYHLSKCTLFSFASQKGNFCCQYVIIELTHGMLSAKGRLGRQSQRAVSRSPATYIARFCTGHPK
jgi:hypothetical protein